MLDRQKKFSFLSSMPLALCSMPFVYCLLFFTGSADGYRLALVAFQTILIHRC